jgi:hypothetical protein
MDLHKQDGGIHPSLRGEIWRHCFTSLTVNTTPVRNEVVKFFTSTYDNFFRRYPRWLLWESSCKLIIYCGTSYWVKILSVFYDSLDTLDPNDPEVIIKIDMSNVFTLIVTTII